VQCLPAAEAADAAGALEVAVDGVVVGEDRVAADIERWRVKQGKYAFQRSATTDNRNRARRQRTKGLREPVSGGLRFSED
jgi:hypothetical protein